MSDHRYPRAPGGPWTYRGRPVPRQPEGIIHEASPHNLPRYLRELGAARGEQGKWTECPLVLGVHAGRSVQP